MLALLNMPKEGIDDLNNALADNEKFRALFVNPDTRFKAINEGNGGKSFDLTDEEKAKLLSSKGNSFGKIMTDFFDYPEIET